MPFPNPLLPVILIAACFAGCVTWILGLAASGSYRAHTQFAFAQITEHLNERSGTELPKNERDLILLLHEAFIDWNSCNLNGNCILDSWAVAVRMKFDDRNLQWTFRSAGEDRKFDTPDDISAQTSRSEPSAPSNGDKPSN
jgi:hypothetical protein